MPSGYFVLSIGNAWGDVKTLPSGSLGKLARGQLKRDRWEKFCIDGPEVQ